jgi:hypothetical protein
VHSCPGSVRVAPLVALIFATRVREVVFEVVGMACFCACSVLFGFVRKRDCRHTVLTPTMPITLAAETGNACAAFTRVRRYRALHPPCYRPRMGRFAVNHGGNQPALTGSVNLVDKALPVDTELDTTGWIPAMSARIKKRGLPAYQTMRT